MKTIMRIIIILLVAALVAAGFNLLVSKTSIAAGGEGFEGRQPPGLSADGGTFQPRFEGGEGHSEGASLEGVLGIFGSLIKISAVGALVLLIQKGISLLAKKKPSAPQSA
jgi:hypothetical protein